jgi:hypothetical protein
MSHATYPIRLTLGNICHATYPIRLTLGNIRHATYPIRLTLGNIRHETYQNHLERDYTHDELTAEEVEQKQGTEHGVELLSEPEAERTDMSALPPGGAALAVLCGGVAMEGHRQGTAQS